MPQVVRYDGNDVTIPEQWNASKHRVYDDTGRPYYILICQERLSRTGKAPLMDAVPLHGLTTDYLTTRLNHLGEY